MPHNEDNLLLFGKSHLCDWRFGYPEGTEKIYAYLEFKNRDVVFFGLQYVLKKYLTGVVVTPEKITQ